jgi:hypothetical protein
MLAGAMWVQAITPIDAFGSLPYRWEIADSFGDYVPRTKLYRTEKECWPHINMRAGQYCRQRGLDYSPTPQPSDYSENCQWVINWPKGQTGYYCTEGDCAKALNAALRTTDLKGQRTMESHP